jgi:hypothetical protein
MISLEESLEKAREYSYGGLTNYYLQVLIVDVWWHHP